MNEQYMNSIEQEPKISLREANHNDLDFVLELNKINMKKYVEKIRGWDEDAERADMERKFSPEVDKIIQVNGKDAGVFRVSETDEKINLEHIELLPEYQGKGIGKTLIEELLKKGKLVTLQVLKGNPAGNLYKKLGFEITGQTDLKYQMAWQPKEEEKNNSVE